VRIGIEDRTKDIEIILNFITKNSGREIKIEEALLYFLKKNVKSSDLFFIILKELQEMNLVEGKRGKVKIKKIGERSVDKVKRKVIRRIEKINKLFVTPLEVAKFFQCPRRLWLEKIVLSKQFKEKKGKIWDGEVIHYAVKIFVSNFGKERSLKKLVEKSARQAIQKYEDKITIGKKEIKKFLESVFNFFVKEKFEFVIAEKNIESLQTGINGSPDLIGIRENGDVVAIDIKAGEIKKGRIRKEHILQNIGESLLVEKFFRKKVSRCYLLYFKSNAAVRINIDEKLKREFLRYRRVILKYFKSNKIPPKSKLPNYRERVCKGCHVKPACDNIEIFKRFEMY